MGTWSLRVEGLGFRALWASCGILCNNNYAILLGARRAGVLRGFHLYRHNPALHTLWAPSHKVSGLLPAGNPGRLQPSSLSAATLSAPSASVDPSAPSPAALQAQALHTAPSAPSPAALQTEQRYPAFMRNWDNLQMCLKKGRPCFLPVAAPLLSWEWLFKSMPGATYTVQLPYWFEWGLRV